MLLAPRCKKNIELVHSTLGWNVRSLYPPFDAGAIGIEIWTMTLGIFYDNLLIDHDEVVARSFAERTWNLKWELEKEPEKKSSVVMALYSSGLIWPSTHGS